MKTAYTHKFEVFSIHGEDESWDSCLEFHYFDDVLSAIRNHLTPERFAVYDKEGLIVRVYQDKLREVVKSGHEVCVYSADYCYIPHSPYHSTMCDLGKTSDWLNDVREWAIYSRLTMRTLYFYDAEELNSESKPFLASTSGIAWRL